MAWVSTADVWTSSFSRFVFLFVCLFVCFLLPTVIITVEPEGKDSFVYSCMRTKLIGQYNGK